MLKTVILIFALLGPRIALGQTPEPPPDPQTVSAAIAPAPEPKSTPDPDLARIAKVGPNSVKLVTKSEAFDLTPLPGAFASTYAYITVLFYADFPEMSAPIHIKDPLPSLFIYAEIAPRGRLFLVKAKVNQRTNNRSVKLGRSGFASMSGVMTPDGDWTIPFTFKPSKRENVWEIIPKSPLKPGEYGIYQGMNIATGMVIGGMGSVGSLFDFAVDK